MASFILPILATVVWLIHVWQYTGRSHHRWAQLFCLGLLPFLCIGLLFLTGLDPAGIRVAGCSTCLTERYQTTLANVGIGLALWIVFLVLEGPLHLIVWFRGRGTKPDAPG